MERVPEPELMDDPAQVAAYARADFAGVNQGFVDAFVAAFPDLHGRVADLGCGPADITVRLARALPGLRVTAIDGARAMLAEARRTVAGARLRERIALVRARVPDLPFPARTFEAVATNSLLHHLPEPAVFWQEVRRIARPGAALFVMDLARPDSPERARELVEHYAADEHPILRQDFYHSFLAAFTPFEVRAQLSAAGLGEVDCRMVSDRHWRASGRVP